MTNTKKEIVKRIETEVLEMCSGIGTAYWRVLQVATGGDSYPEKFVKRVIDSMIESGKIVWDDADLLTKKEDAFWRDEDESQEHWLYDIESRRIKLRTMEDYCNQINKDLFKFLPEKEWW